MNRIARIGVVLTGTLVLAQFINGLEAIAIGFAVLGVWILLDNKKRIRGSEMHRLGLSPEEAQAVESDMASGNNEAVVERFQEAQQRQRASLLEQGIDPLAIIALIGQDIKWTDIVRQVFRVLEFDRAGTTVNEDDTVKAASLHEPYGYLLVESPILSVKARLPICHRDDFVLATRAFDEPQSAERVSQEELLVTYFPKHKLPKGLLGITHGLHYVLVPRGTLERYYEFNNDMHMANPAPEKLFKRFTWDGDICVEINNSPEL